VPAKVDLIASYHYLRNVANFAKSTTCGIEAARTWQSFVTTNPGARVREPAFFAAPQRSFIVSRLR
jgi:hypothetical protein